MNMTNVDLDLLLSKLFNKSRTHYLGVFSRDFLPTPSYIKANTPCCYVANTDYRGGEGKHWVAFYHPNPNHIDFFDSFGQDPKFYGFILPPCFHVVCNSRQIQSNLSIVCGAYSVFFLWHRNRGLSLSTISNNLSALSNKQSDAYVFKCIRKLKQYLSYRK